MKLIFSNVECGIEVWFADEQDYPEVFIRRRSGKVIRWYNEGVCPIRSKERIRKKILLKSGV